MNFLQGELVALIVAIVTAVAFLVKISLQLQDYFYKIERALLGVKNDLRETSASVTQEQMALRQEIFAIKKHLSYVTRILAELRPDAFKRDSDFDS